MAYSMLKDKNGRVPKLRIINWSGNSIKVAKPFIPKDWQIDQINHFPNGEKRRPISGVRVDDVEYEISKKIYNKLMGNQKGA